MKYLVCNLKNKLNTMDIVKYNRRLGSINSNIKLVITPSYPFIPLFNKDGYSIGSQDITSFIDKTITGEVTGEQLKSFECKYVIVGHSERREYKKEINIDFINKITNATEVGMTVIYCIGEDKAAYEKGRTLEVLEKQISEVLNNVEVKNIIIAYEPVWAIGTGITPSLEEINDITSYIKDIIKDKYDTILPVLYGGSVTLNNIDKLKKTNVDGFLVGSASLDANNVKKMLEILEN